MRVYLDTSALVKRYVVEPGSRTVRELFSSPRVAPATSRVTHAEVVSAVARRAREGSLAPTERERILDQLERDLGGMVIVDVTARVTRPCRELATRSPLRGFDCLHLASALLLANGSPARWTFVCSDRQLLAAAEQHGLAVLDPAAEPGQNWRS